MAYKIFSDSTVKIFYNLGKKSFWLKVGKGIGVTLGLYIVAAFFFPIVPMTANWVEWLSSKMYVATWTQVYAPPSTLSTMSGDVKIPRRALPGVTPWNSKQVNYFILVSPDAVYYRGAKIEGADPYTLSMVTEHLSLGLGSRYSMEVPLYFYDDNNVYIGNSLVLPREDKPASIVYAEYQLERFYNTEWETKLSSNGIVTSHRKDGKNMLKEVIGD